MTAAEGPREWGRRGGLKKYEAYRAERLAAGLPATKAEETGRKPEVLTPGPLEDHWIAKAVATPLGKNLGRRALRRLAKRMADAEAAEQSRRMRIDGPDAPPVGDDDLLVAFYESEASRFRQRARRDRELAKQHERMADDAEIALANLMFRLGRAR